MSSVQIEQKSCEMHPRDGFTATHFITVADIDRSADFYVRVFAGRRGRVLSFYANGPSLARTIGRYSATVG